MSSRPDLRLDWCSHAAAKYAVEHWHYSRQMPAGKMARLGVWENGAFVGAVIFATSACPWLGSPYGLTQFEACELVRVALRRHSSPVTRIVRVAVAFLRRLCPGTRLVVSYADPEQGHHGGIYQGGGWIYVGDSAPKWTANGQHNRAFGTSVAAARRRYGPSVQIVMHAGKHKYLMPLDAEMRAQLAPLAQPYPKRSCATSSAGAASAFQAEEGGSTPTVALQLTTVGPERAGG